MKTPLGILVLAGVLLSGCTADREFKTSDVSRSDFGEHWPFSADAGTLACEPGDVPTFTVDGSTVGLSNPNLSTAVWSDSATDTTAHRMRDEALALCE